MFLANAGLPMLTLAWPLAFLLIIPIVAIEAWASRGLTLPLSRRIASISVANVVSTLVGWPIAWWCLVALQMHVIPGGGGAYGLSTQFGIIASVSLQAAWLIPYEDDIYWMVPAACAFLMVPFFLASVIIEDQIHRFGFSDLSSSARRKLTWKVNLWSYGFLISLFLFWLAWSLVMHTPQK